MMVKKLFPDLHSWAADGAASLHRYPEGTKAPRSLAGDRAERRWSRQVEQQMKYLDDPKYIKAQERYQKQNKADDNAMAKMRTAVAKEYHKKHPELSRIRARLRSIQTGTGAKIMSLYNQGWSGTEIAKKLRFNAKKGTFGRSGGRNLL
ncbi:hypothetical protein L2721_02945 [Lactobacillus crispatus]|uniref:hypothetical protein n=2 Tax=Lactobacillus crispatus TaxID=47770 RepID=UPI0022AC7DCC|nr:hypothetical protein [Lactobacillus crispatus]MCZ3674395.1 hypothetical protein [Lactobacillus crispatus]MCZ3682202.1 hypothetical protein [Lactobacillus crispatus]